MAIHVGTSGFSYEDWRGIFYPKDLPKQEMLSFYSKHFGVVEVNSTYYRLPGAVTFARMSQKVPEGFLFAVKANREMTHEIRGNSHAPESKGGASNDVFARFVESVSPLVSAGQLACVLLQFPWSFDWRDEHLEYLSQLPHRLQGLPAVVEFRNREWVREETFDLLRRCGLGYCCVDEPALKGLMPRIVVATSPIGYVRFHGRNAQRWWQHEVAWQRYDYLYSEQELAEWVPRLRKLSEQTAQTFVFFNNHYQGQAGTNARMLMQLLDQAA